MVRGRSLGMGTVPTSPTCTIPTLLTCTAFTPPPPLHTLPAVPHCSKGLQGLNSKAHFQVPKLVTDYIEPHFFLENCFSYLYCWMTSFYFSKICDTAPSYTSKSASELLPLVLTTRTLSGVAAPDVGTCRFPSAAQLSGSELSSLYGPSCARLPVGVILQMG